MIKAMGELDGKKVLILGLSWGNLKKFKDAPGDSYIHIMGAELGIDIDIMIISDKTENDMANLIRKGLAPNAKVYVQPITTKGVS